MLSHVRLQQPWLAAVRRSQRPGPDHPQIRHRQCHGGAQIRRGPRGGARCGPRIEGGPHELLVVVLGRGGLVQQRADGARRGSAVGQLRREDRRRRREELPRDDGGREGVGAVGGG
ncbi:unnamed protein product [Linum tenue]|uniref:Uncharacterized protein n=1 Tax=Linum tenue TaxID=586396 RepID=A0AAV0S1S8_9ROSI|nr:unnamed protein product [Linum tenue]